MMRMNVNNYLLNALQNSCEGEIFNFVKLFFIIRFRKLPLNPRDALQMHSVKHTHIQSLQSPSWNQNRKSKLLRYVSMSAYNAQLERAMIVASYWTRTIQ